MYGLYDHEMRAKRTLILGKLIFLSVIIFVKQFSGVKLTQILNTSRHLDIKSRHFGAGAQRGPRPIHS
jgi:hypothetical protein